MSNSKQPDWSGKTCVVAASGPSLTSDQLIRVHRTGNTPIIVTNSSWIRALFAEVIYGCDFMWWKMNHAVI